MNTAAAVQETAQPGRSPADERRHTAAERREEILGAAVVRFGQTGLHGTSTETIAADAGVSQPYLFRLFGTKKDLFLAAVDWGFQATLEAFRKAGAAAEGPHDAFRAIGEAYLGLISDRRYLDIQLQAYATTHDPDVRRLVQDGFGRLVSEVIRQTGATPAQLAAFLGRGMLLNVSVAMGVAEEETGWPVMVREGCIGGLEE
jgi:AcrR family transcriptional regulator